MSVVPMQKVRLSVYRPDVDSVLDVVQKYGAVEFKLTDWAEGQEPDMVFQYASLLARVQHAVNFLTPYAHKKSLWKSLREGTRAELTEGDLKNRLDNLDVVPPLVEDFERLQVEFAEVNEKLRQLEEQHQLLYAWKDLPIKLSDFSTNKTKTILVKQNLNIKGTPSLASRLESDLNTAQIEFTVTEVSDSKVALTLSNEAGLLQKIDSIVTEINAEILTTPLGTETPDVEFIAVSEKLAAAKSELALLHDQAEHFAITHINQLQVASEILSWQKSRYDVVSEAAATEYTMMFDGWLNINKQQEIEAVFIKKELTAVFSNLELGEDEEPPVDIVNNKLVQPFEAVTRLYGMPGYKDLDPTAYLAGFFFLFFGLSLTDVGYGIFLMVVSTIIITLFKVSDALRLFAKLLFFVGLATVFVGASFGGYLGIAPEKLPDFLVALQKFDPIGNPLPVFYLALSLGVFQVMVGMLLKIYSEYKNGRLMRGLIVQGPWFIVFCLAIFALLTNLGYVALLSFETIKNLIYVGLVLVVLSGSTNGEGFFGKILSSAASLYDSIGYFSDILSYSRLLALGLATTALAFAVNLIAGMVAEVPYVGYILAGVILIVGHLFNLVVNTLGAFIHSARLQFVEFFGKFILGTGKTFSPLSRTEKYITVKKE